MDRDNAATPIDRLSALRKREQALRAAIALENNRQYKRNQRNRMRLVTIVGEALLDGATRTPEIAVMLRRVLTNITDERTKRFLADVGWG